MAVLRVVAVATRAHDGPNTEMSLKTALWNRWFRRGLWSRRFRRGPRNRRFHSNRYWRASALINRYHGGLLHRNHGNGFNGTGGSVAYGTNGSVDMFTFPITFFPPRGVNIWNLQLSCLRLELADGVGHGKYPYLIILDAETKRLHQVSTLTSLLTLPVLQYVTSI